MNRATQKILVKPSRLVFFIMLLHHVTWHLPATREAPKIISRALQELYSQKNRDVGLCWLASLKRERLATRDLKGQKNLTRALLK